MSGCSTCSFKQQIPAYNKQGFEEGDYYKLNAYDYLKNYLTADLSGDIVEVQFKNTRKGFYRNTEKIQLNIGDLIAVEAANGHDIGRVKLFHQLASVHIKESKKPIDADNLLKVYRKARGSDIEKWTVAKYREKDILRQSRQIAQQHKLELKISNVDIQGDNTKVIIFYIADGRIDFRQLIKDYARTFNMRIEMRQIGARQEAAMVGGIGSCGRELCCSSWRNDFDTVNTQAARYQELPLGAQKLAGQCGKLKCCLMYELDTYLEARKDFPEELLELETEKGVAYQQKIDILNKTIYYSLSKDKTSADLIPLSVDRVKQIIQLNKRGIKVKHLVAQKKIEKDYNYSAGNI